MKAAGANNRQEKPERQPTLAQRAEQSKQGELLWQTWPHYELKSQESQSIWLVTAYAVRTAWGSASAEKGRK